MPCVMRACVERFTPLYTADTETAGGLSYQLVPPPDRMLVTWTVTVMAVQFILCTCTAGAELGTSKISKTTTLIHLLEKIIQEKKRTTASGNQYPPIKTYGGNSGGKPCVFPFIHEKKEIFACICKYDERPWCSTEKNYDTERMWGYCHQTPTSAAFRFGERGPGIPCLFPFSYFGETKTQCECGLGRGVVYPWCSADRQYNHNWGFCAVTACPDDYCGEGGVCSVVSSQYKPYFKCSCKTGYTGERCKSRESACPRGYCGEGGVCSVVSSQYKLHFKCSCKTGYTGERCQSRESVAEDCGVPSLSPERRIVGGEAAKKHAWPWQAGLVYSPRGDFVNPQMNFHKCGASVLNKRWLLTAAHCVDWFNPETRMGYKDLNPSHYRVKLGDHTRSAVEEAEEVRAVQKIVPFPRWDFTQFANDVALIKVSKDISFSPHVRPVCLPKKKAREKQYCFLTGWGRTNVHFYGQSETLMQVKLRLLPAGECERTGTTEGNKEHVLCFGYEGNQHKGACMGDSGGPVNCLVDGRWVQEGVASYVQMSQTTGLYCMEGQSFYAEVYDYIDWIKNTIAAG